MAETQTLRVAMGLAPRFYVVRRRRTGVVYCRLFCHGRHAGLGCCALKFGANVVHIIASRGDSKPCVLDYV